MGVLEPIGLVDAGVNGHQDYKGHLQGPEHGKGRVHQLAHHMIAPKGRFCSHPYNVGHLPGPVPDQQFVGIQVEHGNQFVLVKAAQNPVLLQTVLGKVPFIERCSLLFKAKIPKRRRLGQSLLIQQAKVHNCPSFTTITALW